MHLLAALLAISLAASAPPHAATSGTDLCVPQLQLLNPAACPALGPGAYVADLSSAQLPDVIPGLPLAPLTKYDPVVDLKYARVTTRDAPLFASPDDGVANNPTRPIGKGLIYVNLVQAVQAGGQDFYQIHTGEYIRAGDVKDVTPTNFQGVLFSQQPQYPIAWMVSNVRPSPMPGVRSPDSGPHLWRKMVVQIFAIQHVGQYDWYLIGPNQWVEQRAVARLNLNSPPPGVSGRWIQVDLFEQTLAAYEDNRLVYASLVSSGLDEWPTRPGLFHIYSKLIADRMRGTYRADGSDYYYLEAVPWVMYFDGSRALHGEYWHDGLGFKRSHGCVNLAPLDARWLFDWASRGTPVWVYDPSGKTPTNVDAAGGAP
jgi:lipoprotein-anchoring transpeptidase ErfK/SrfK